MAASNESPVRPEQRDRGGSRCGTDRHVSGWARVLAYDPRPGQSVAVALTPELLDKVITELVLVAASATSKREEAANLARIWGRRVEPDERAATA